jgi:hypothetical protein
VLTGIVFALAFVMVLFRAIAYSPRLLLWFARDQNAFSFAWSARSTSRWGTSEIRYLEFAPSLCECALCYLWFKCPYCYCSFSASWSAKKGGDSRKPNEGGVKARKLEGTLCTFGAKELP